MALSSNDTIIEKMISVIIPTHNRKNLLKQCVRSVLRQDFPSHGYEIIVIDDGSRDDTEVFLKKASRHIKNLSYHRNPVNQGRSSARNKGIDLARGEIIAFTDDDCVLPREWLSGIIQTFQRHPDAAAVGGSIINPSLSPASWAEYILIFSAWFPVGRERSVRNIPTCNVAYRKICIEGLLFSLEGKNLNYRDTLLNFTLSKKGGRLIFNPRLPVYHYRWHATYSFNDFLETQRKQARGFIWEGYEFHGRAGKLLIRFRFLNFLYPALIFALVRCLRRKKYTLMFFKTCILMLKGEQEKARIISSW